MKTKIIYTSWLAFALQQAGFEILRTGKNPHHPQYDTYIFEDTEALRQALTQLTRKQ
jgi:hypothetical protein